MKLRLSKNWFARKLAKEEGDCTAGNPNFRDEVQRFGQLAAAIEKDINAIGSIYPTVAMYDEPRQRLAQRIARKILDGDYHA